MAYSESARKLRRCTAARRDGTPCANYAAWGDDRGLCSAHGGRHAHAPTPCGRREGIVNPTPRKNGRPRKLDATAKLTALAILTAGGSMVDVRDELAVDRRTVDRERHRDAGFARGVMRAVRAGKIKLLGRVARSRSWRAAAWLMERRWGWTPHRTLTTDARPLRRGKRATT